MERKQIENPLYKYKKLIFIFIIVLLLVFAVMTNSKDIKQGFEKMQLIPWSTTIILFLLLMAYIAIDTHILKVSIDDKLLRSDNAFTINMAGSFFSAITPMYIGSYPSRVYYLYKEGIEVDKILSGLTIKGLSYQIILTLFGVVAYFFTPIVISSGWELAFFLGILLNIVLATFLILISSSKKFNEIVIRLVHRLSKKFNFFKKRETELMNSINNYYNKTRRMYSDFNYTFQVFFSSFVKLVIYYIMPLVIFHGLGLDTKTYFIEIIAVASIIQIMISVIPTPGGMGASEYVFILLYGILYSNIANEGDIEAGMLIYLFLSHYSLIIIGMVCMLLLQTKRPKRHRKA
jgi:uncharacterized protein (TIRG00374 family)